MATYTSIFHLSVMGAGAAFNTASTGNTEQHCTLRAMVWTPVAGNTSNHAILGYRKIATWLMAVDTQVASATIKGWCPFNSENFYRVSRLQSEVVPRVGSVDLMTGAAILTGWIGISHFNLVWMEACGNTRTKATT
jgi:hypothetical protein